MTLDQNNLGDAIRLLLIPFSGYASYKIGIWIFERHNKSERLKNPQPPMCQKCAATDFKPPRYNPATDKLEFICNRCGAYTLLVPLEPRVEKAEVDMTETDLNEIMRKLGVATYITKSGKMYHVPCPHGKVDRYCVQCEEQTHPHSWGYRG